MLVDVVIDNGLISTASNGYAESVSKYMQRGTLSDIVQNWEYQAIGDDSIADTLMTTEPIQDGDNLVIYFDNVITEIEASGVVDDTLGSGYYTLDTTAITAGGIPQGYLIDKTLDIDFGDGYVSFPATDTFSFDVTLQSVTTYPEYLNESTSAIVKIGFSAAGNKMVDMSSKVCYDLFSDCFLTADDFKIQTKDNLYFCAIGTEVSID